MNRLFAIYTRWCRHCALLLLTTLLGCSSAAAEIFPRPPLGVDLVGRLQTAVASEQDTLLDIAYRFDLGQNEILTANPNVDRWLPGAGTRVNLPTRFILPDAPRQGIILNLPEMRLYYFPENAEAHAGSVITHPVSIGRMDWKTPLGATRVTSKQKDPTWTPPKSVRDEAAAEGDRVPDIVPPGPDNPLGRYALRLGIPGYLIHGTNKPFGVGMRVTHGCVRMYPRDIEALFEHIPVATRVQIVNQPVKAGWLADTLYLEVHPPLEEDESGTDLMKIALDIIHAELEIRPAILDAQAVRRTVSEQSGVPTPISRDSATY